MDIRTPYTLRCAAHSHQKMPDIISRAFGHEAEHKAASSRKSPDLFVRFCGAALQNMSMMLNHGRTRSMHSALTGTSDGISYSALTIFCAYSRSRAKGYRPNSSANRMMPQLQMSASCMKKRHVSRTFS